MLVSARQQDVGLSPHLRWERLELSPLPVAEALDLLAGEFRAPPTAKEETQHRQIVEGLGALPLAVQLAAGRLKQGLAASPTDKERGWPLLTLCESQQNSGQLTEALTTAEQEAQFERSRGDDRGLALSLGKIADIYQAQGQLDEALRIRREEALPVYEKLDDIREAMICRWWLARYYLQRGQTGDRRAARELLSRALAEAKALRLPEAATLAQELKALDCPSTMAALATGDQLHRGPAFTLRESDAFSSQGSALNGAAIGIVLGGLSIVGGAVWLLLDWKRSRERAAGGLQPPAGTAVAQAQ